jgi:hypothetical protein
MAAGEVVGERLELIERSVVVIERPRAAEAVTHERAVALGQMVEHVSLFVTHAALDRGVEAEHVADRRRRVANGFGPTTLTEFEICAA